MTKMVVLNLMNVNALNVSKLEQITAKGSLQTQRARQMFLMGDGTSISTKLGNFSKTAYLAVSVILIGKFLFCVSFIFQARFHFVTLSQSVTSQISHHSTGLIL